MGQCLVNLRVERVALVSVGHQAEPAPGRLQGVGDRLETAGQLAVLPGLVDGVEHGQQSGQRAGHRLLTHGRPVPVDSLAVVGVLGLQSLQVGGPLRELSLDILGLLAARGRALLRGAGDGFRCNHLWNLFGVLLRFLGVLVFLRSGGPGGSGRLGGFRGFRGFRGVGRGGRPAGPSGAGRLRRHVLTPNLTGYRVDGPVGMNGRSEEHTSELQSPSNLVFRLIFLNDTATTDIYTLSLHDALPISGAGRLRRHVLTPNLTGYRVDAPVVMNDRTGARFLGCWHQAAPCSLPSPSSTISASTTSSSAGVASPSAEPGCALAWAA